MEKNTVIPEKGFNVSFCAKLRYNCLFVEQGTVLLKLLPRSPSYTHMLDLIYFDIADPANKSKDRANLYRNNVSKKYAYDRLVIGIYI